MQKTVSLKTYILTSLLIALICIGFTGLVLSQTEIAIVKDSFIKGASFIIENDDGTYKSFNGQTGGLSYSGTNGKTVIQNTLDALTSGRTSKEKITIKGDIEIDDTIQIDSYTILDLQGKLTATTSATMIENADQVSGNTQIEITGGILDASVGDSGACIHFETVTDSTISNIILNGHGWGIYFNDYTQYCTIKNSIIENCTKAIYLEYYSGHNWILENTLSNNEYGIYGKPSSSGNHNLYVERNIIEGTTVGDAIYVWEGFKWHIIDNFIKDYVGHAIEIYEADRGEIAFNFMDSGGDSTESGLKLERSNYVTVESNFIEAHLHHGIHLIDVRFSTISRNFISTCDTDSTETYNGIRLEKGAFNSGCDQTVLRENYIYDSVGSAVKIADDTKTTDVVIQNNKMTGDIIDLFIDDGGINTVIKSNIGWLTENSGTETDLANGGTISHGLVNELFIPTSVRLTCLNATYDNVPLVVSWDQINTDEFDIYVNIYWANGTAITDNVIDVSWYVEYHP